MDQERSNKKTIVGTDIEEVKAKNAQSGMSYNEAKAFIAREMGGYGTGRYSDTDVEEVKREIQESYKKNNQQ
ncbi:gamma type small acid-soluble spore protein [Pullulanibacillus pueri]|uniref:Gamma-type small acid-soluble spore protein n=1 Tax=Pullulanibacillus pueri TaxID=1437324 RepID=A0A8J2ZXP7_9BACL|nr:gamma-type small acid-soluble spore protein [Pullulanibacillus pueri]MBM7683234.1 gamma type small acid-soluble spore protein [Pullulanibacillus pueri]GGH85496.1 hypothetical protein GCM10007096_31020 [Pullulanibacillus pueri]